MQRSRRRWSDQATNLPKWTAESKRFRKFREWYKVNVNEKYKETNKKIEAGILLKTKANNITLEEERRGGLKTYYW